MEDPPKKFFRLAPGREVRLRYAYLATCTDVVRDEGGEIEELHCTVDPESRGGNAPDGRKVKGTIHWVSAPHAVDGEIYLYEHLFAREDPEEVSEGEDWLGNLNPESLRVVRGAKLEPALADATPDQPIQFERIGYFVADEKDSHSEAVALPPS